MTKRLISIGVLGQKENNETFHIITEILKNFGCRSIYNNPTFSILLNKSDFIIIFQVTKDVAEKIRDLNMSLDALIYSGLKLKDYNSLSIKYLVKNSRYLIMNIDENDWVNILTDNVKSLIVTYGLNKKATITASSLTFDRNIKFNICIQREFIAINGTKIEPMEFPITVDLIGRYSFYNSLAAITFALIYGVPIDKINDSLSNIKLPTMRLEKIYNDNFIIILDSYCKDSSDYNFVFEEIQYVKYNNIYIITEIDSYDEFYRIKSNLVSIFEWQPALNLKKIFLYLVENNILLNMKLKFLFSNVNLDYSILPDIESCIYCAKKYLNNGDLLLILGNNCEKDVKRIVYQLKK